MKKAFVWDPTMRSSALKYDPCVIPKGKKSCKLKCEDCVISLIADRFLGEEFHKKTLGKYLKNSRLKYAYVIIADTIGCNLNCWFCYAWKFLDKKIAEKSCKTAFVSPKRLAEQFYCKFKQISSIENLKNKINEKTFLNEKIKKSTLKHIDDKLPIKRIRISGGEPIFNNKENTMFEEQESFSLDAVDFWVKFFKELDKKIELLKKEGVIEITEDWNPKNHFPSCLAEVKDKLTIRFDTNGILFANKKITEKFVAGIYDLYKKGELNHLFIQIDYSIKGATPNEFYWSQSIQLPVREETNIQFKPQEHPQFAGYNNITSEISKYSSLDKNFDNVLDIFAERGIDHNIKDKLFLNYKGSFNWGNFTAITGINFSEVSNPIDLNFGWNFSGKMFRYAKRKALLELSNDENRVNTEIANFSEIRNFRAENFMRPDFKMLIYPIGRDLNLKESRAEKPKVKTPEQTTLENINTLGWLLSGNKKNWEIAIDKKLWGLSSKRKSVWQNIKLGDVLLFYVTQPLSKIIGYAKVTKTYEGKELIWLDEINENELKYPFRIEFEPIKILPEKLWIRKGVSTHGLQFYHGINPISDKEKLTKVMEELKSLLSSPP